MFRIIKKYIELPGSDKKLFFEAVRLTFWIRLRSFFLNFNKNVSKIGVPHKESLIKPDSDQLKIIYKVFRAMRRSSIYLPFNNSCLYEALVVKLMLNSRGIESTFYLGVSKDSTKQLKAHAWLKCGDTIITGRRGMENYTSIEWYT